MSILVCKKPDCDWSGVESECKRKDTGCCTNKELLICPGCGNEIEEIDTSPQIPEGHEYWKLSH